jgi:hypothetical protein
VHHTEEISMRIPALSLFGALGLAVSVVSASAAPAVLVPPPPQASNIVQVAGDCERGLHPYRGCVRHRYYRPHAYYHRYYRPYGYYRPYPYYGAGYQPWNRPSPTDHVANQLNAQQLGGGYYRGY